MTEPARKPARRPSPGAVLWGSVALFAALFVLIAYQVGASGQATATAARPTLVRKVVKRRVVTTIVPTPGRSTVSTEPGVTSESGSTEPITTGAS